MRVNRHTDGRTYATRRPPVSRIARDKAIEKNRIRYFPLECGHLTSYEEADENDAFRELETTLGPLWYACSHCLWAGRPYWHKRKKAEKVMYPDAPLF